MRRGMNECGLLCSPTKPHRTLISMECSPKANVFSVNIAILVRLILNFVIRPLYIKLVVPGSGICKLIACLGGFNIK